MSGHLLLTGATGQVGQYLLRDLLVQDVPLAVLMRAKGKESAEERLDNLIAYWEGELGRELPRPVCLEGDITADGLELGPRARAWVASHCSCVLHNAASLTFFGKDRGGEPWLSNVTGTANVLDVCRASGIRELHYMSTAYVCGDRPGPVYESDLKAGQRFHNDYEEAKFEAERLVRDADFLDDLTVYRPAVIVGDFHTGYTATYHGLYSYLHFVWLFCRSRTPEPDGRIRASMRITLTGEEHRNLIPVDWVSAVTTHVLLHPEWHGRTYHLTPVRPATAREIEDGLAEYFNYYGPVFVGPRTLDHKNKLEDLFYDFVSQYQPYWQREPVFDCANTLQAAPHLPCPVVDSACLHRLLDFAIADRWGKRKHVPRKPAVPRVKAQPSLVSG